jgi:hypothetical protein
MSVSVNPGNRSARGIAAPDGLQPGVVQGSLHWPGRVRDAGLAIGDQIEVLGGPVDDAVLDQSAGAAQRQAVAPPDIQGDRGDLALQLV